VRKKSMDIPEYVWKDLVDARMAWEGAMFRYSKALQDVFVEIGRWIKSPVRGARDIEIREMSIVSNIKRLDKVIPRESILYSNYEKFVRNVALDAIKKLKEGENPKDVTAAYWAAQKNFSGFFSKEISKISEPLKTFIGAKI
jgi:hypothetical protein